MWFNKRHFSSSRAVIEDTHPTRIGTTDPRILWALELFEKKASARVSDVAANLNLSSSRFRHLFKQELGLSPKHYLKLRRLKQAKKLLENSFLRVKEVTTIVGANDVSHFSRDYKAVYRQTPSQTRALFARVPSQTAISAKK